MNDIQTYVELFLDDITLSISVTDNLEKQEGNLKNFGYIKIEASKPVYWDNLYFFMDAGYKKFKRECKSDLKEYDIKVKQTYKTIQKLLKRAYKLNLLR